MGGVVYDLSLLYKHRENILKDWNVIVDPLSQLSSESIQFEYLSNMVRKFGVVSEVSFFWDNSSNELKLNHYHHCTYFYNREQYFCIDMFYNNGRDVTLTKINYYNFLDFFKIHNEGGNFFAFKGNKGK